ncbi:MAG TPA: UDP-N-acetylmuramoyl-L-alanine--D-glutamate ligase [Candidatus Saccharimonadales bacterium]
MKIAILGFGLQGKSSLKYYRGPDNEITICDQNQPTDVPDEVEVVVGDNYLSNLDYYDLIIRSPAIHPKDIVAANGYGILKKVSSNTNEFLRTCPSKNVIGVTGTKGKGTTSTLITKMLEANGKRVHLGGNIGVPPLDLLDSDITEQDWVVLELANFQLIDLKYSPHISLCLMVEPEHLDWHIDVDEYYEAKTLLFRTQSPKDIAVYFADNENSVRIAFTGAAKKIPYFKAPGAMVAGNHIVIDGEPVIRLSELKMIGRHNYQNACAAVTAVWQICPDVGPIAQVLRDFSGLPFRLEFRQQVDDISFFNDSYASAPAATIAAISAIKSPKVLIIGGKDRGLDLNDLVEAIIENQETIKDIVLIGESANRVSEELTNASYDNFTVNESTDIKDIVIQAKSMATAGDSVVLSPGFPSFDMFKNFEDRGLKFNDAVSSL